MADDRRDPSCPDRRAFPARRAHGRRETDPWPDHGTRARYRRGCPCLPCRAANAAYQADYRMRKIRGVLMLGAIVAAAETWRQLRLLTTEYETEEALAHRLGLKDGRLRYGRRRCRVSTMLKIRAQYEFDILAGLPTDPCVAAGYKN